MKKLTYTFLMGCLLGLPMGLFSGSNKLDKAIEADDVSEVAELLEGNGLCDDALLHAVQNGSNMAIESFLAGNPDYNLELPDPKGNTLLENALIYERMETVRFLLDRGANSKDVLHEAVVCGSKPEMIQYLLSRGDIDLNAVDAQRKTPTFIALDSGLAEAARLLQENGGRISAVSPRVETDNRLTRFLLEQAEEDPAVETRPYVIKIKLTEAVRQQLAKNKKPVKKKPTKRERGSSDDELDQEQPAAQRGCVSSQSQFSREADARDRAFGQAWTELFGKPIYRLWGEVRG